MYIIGLTGGIASGKSMVSRILEELGAFIVDADKVAREIVQPGNPAWHDIICHFGKNILLASGEIDRCQLGERIFHNVKERKELENITHPRIRERAQQLLQQASSEGYSVAVLDAPLLLEVGWQDMVDTVWLVYVESQIQVQRLMSRNKLSYEQASARISAQMSVEEKRKYATVAIDNSLDRENTRQQVLRYWYQIHKVNK